MADQPANANAETSNPQAGPVLPLICASPDNVEAVLGDPARQAWAKANGFSGQLGRLLPLPGEGGALEGYAFGMGEAASRPPLALGLASTALQPGRYRIAGDCAEPTLARLGFWLGTYRFTRYKKSDGTVELVDDQAEGDNEVARLVEAAFLARDLINTPANELGPEAFEKQVRDFAKRRGMDVTAIVGDELLEKNFPMIHAVGRASAEAPRLLDLSWGPKDAPKVTLVGKGVTFDTGGLDLKPAQAMLLMKKDMGGAANILGLAHTIVSAKLNVRLRVLLPIVENAVSGASFRPGDILPSRKGITVEIGNTDAEGRLILADALALAAEEAPQLLVDMATLTGAARVALGPELPPIYSTNSELARDVATAGQLLGDPLWPLPLWQPYEKGLASKIADTGHITPNGYAGSITAALFLQKFVAGAENWMHLDIFGWAPEARAGYPLGGADQGVRALYSVIKQTYGAA